MEYWRQTHPWGGTNLSDRHFARVASAQIGTMTPPVDFVRNGDFCGNLPEGVDHVRGDRYGYWVGLEGCADLKKRCTGTRNKRAHERWKEPRMSSFSRRVHERVGGCLNVVLGWLVSQDLVSVLCKAPVNVILGDASILPLTQTLIDTRGMVHSVSCVREYTLVGTSEEKERKYSRILRITGRQTRAWVAQSRNAIS